MEKEPRHVTVDQEVRNHFNIRIAREITSPDDFGEELHAIRSATEHDTVRVELCTPGGNVQTALMIRSALQQCKAPTKGIITSECSSAGTIIALACDSWGVERLSNFMIHAASFGVFGKHNEIVAQFEHKVKWIRRVFDECYSGFLSPQEIEDCIKGNDIWLDSAQIIERLEYYGEYRRSLNSPVDTEEQGE